MAESEDKGFYKCIHVAVSFFSGLASTLYTLQWFDRPTRGTLMIVCAVFVMITSMIGQCHAKNDEKLKLIKAAACTIAWSDAVFDGLQGYFLTIPIDEDVSDVTDIIVIVGTLMGFSSVVMEALKHVIDCIKDECCGPYQYIWSLTLVIISQSLCLYTLAEDLGLIAWGFCLAVLLSAIGEAYKVCNSYQKLKENSNSNRNDYELMDDRDRY